MSLFALGCLSPAILTYQSGIRSYMVNICSKIIVAVICAFIRLNVQSRWLISTIGNTYTHRFQGVFLCFGAGVVKGCSHEQEALGLCSAISPLPGLIRQEIVAISSPSGRGSHGLGQAEQWGLRPTRPPEELSALREGSEKGRARLSFKSIAFTAVQA